MLVNALANVNKWDLIVKCYPNFYCKNIRENILIQLTFCSNVQVTYSLWLIAYAVTFLFIFVIYV